MPIIKNVRQEAFAQALARGEPAAKAYISAGFSPHPSNAAAMARKEHILARVSELLAKHDHIERKATERAIEKLAITKEKVLGELAKIGFTNITDVVKWGAAIAVTKEDGTEYITNGIALVDAKDLSENAAAAIAEVKQTKDGTLTLKLHDKKGALVDLGKHLGLFIDRVEVGGPGDFSNMTDEEIVTELERLADAEIENLHSGNGTVN